MRVEYDKESDSAYIYIKDEIIYILFGEFSDIKGNWILEMIEKFYSNLVKYDNVSLLVDDIEIEEFKKKFDIIEDFILSESLKIDFQFFQFFQDFPLILNIICIHLDIS